MAVSNTDNRVQYSITSTPTTSTEYSYPNRVSAVTDIVVQETTQTPRIPGTITFNQSSDQFALTTHGLVTGNVVQFDGTAITGFTADIDYYVVKIDANNFQLATSVANATASPAVVVTVSGTDNVSVTTLIRAGEQPLTRTLTKDSDYTITPETSGTLITSLVVSPTQAAIDDDKFAVGSTITIYRETNFQQTSNYVPNQIIPADTLEGDLDKLAMMAQQLKDDVGRSVRFAESVTDPANLEIAFDADQRSGKLLSFDADGNFSVSQEIGVWRSAWQSGRAYSARDLVFNDDDTSDDRYSIYFAKTTHTSDSSTAPLEVGANWDKVLDASFFATQVELAQTSGGAASDSADLAEEWASKDDGAVTGTSEYSAKAYAIGGTGVDGNAGSAKDWATKTGGTVDGTNYSAKHWADNSESSASSASTSATNAATSESNAATSETNAATSATAAAGSASSASTSATNAASSASSASTSASNAATSETNAATSETNAASSASAASTSETNAATSATAASTSASSAATSATAAANSATAAGTAQTAAETAQGLAETAQAAAETAYDNFDDRYLGSKTSAPSVDNDGNALLVGALYFDSTAGALRVWNGSAWNSVEALPQPLATTDSPEFAGLDVGNININGNTISSTDTNGNINLTPNGTGSVSLDSAVTINESGADADFRVEASGQANALFVEGSSGRVGIGTNLPGEELHIETTGGATAGIQLSTTGGTVERDWKFLASSSAGTFFIQDATASVNRLAIDSSGNVLINTGTAGYSNSISTSIEASGLNNSRIFVNHSSTGSSNGSLFMGFGYGGSEIGSITQSSTSTVAYNIASDYRLKEDVQPMSGSIDRLKELNPVNFAWKIDGSRVDGFLAHEAQEVVPEAVTGEKDAMRMEKYEVTPAVLDEDGNVITEAVMGEREVPYYQGIDQSKLVPLLTAALQEAVSKIESLEARIETLEATPA